MTETVVYTHDYPYRAVASSGTNAPAVEVRLTVPRKRPLHIVGLVDTGAEYTAFNTSVAKSLGLSMSRGGRWRTVNALGSPGGIQLKFFKVAIEVGGRGREAEVGFFEPKADGSAQGKNLLGRSGFLEHVQAGFRERHQRMFLNFEA